MIHLCGHILLSFQAPVGTMSGPGFVAKDLSSYNKFRRMVCLSVHDNRKGFTLIELLIVIAILGILAAAVLAAINPAKRTRQARDVQRKSDVNAIANALIGYYVITGKYPTDVNCNSSRGNSSFACPIPVGDDWNKIDINRIYYQLVYQQAFLKRLPIDPINDVTYYYRYDTKRGNEQPCLSLGGVPCGYWIGAKLEDPIISNGVFRCTDHESGDGSGCKEVQMNNFGTDNPAFK